MPISDDIKRSYEILLSIEQGDNTLAQIEFVTGIPRSSLKRYLRKIQENFAVKIEFKRVAINGLSGYYEIIEWGVINKSELQIFALNQYQ